MRTNADCVEHNKHLRLNRREAGLKSPVGLVSDPEQSGCSP